MRFNIPQNYFNFNLYPRTVYSSLKYKKGTMKDSYILITFLLSLIWEKLSQFCKISCSRNSSSGQFIQHLKTFILETGPGKVQKFGDASAVRPLFDPALCENPTLSNLGNSGGGGQLPSPNCSAGLGREKRDIFHFFHQGG